MFSGGGGGYRFAGSALAVMMAAAPVAVAAAVGWRQRPRSSDPCAEFSMYMSEPYQLKSHEKNLAGKATYHMAGRPEHGQLVESSQLESNHYVYGPSCLHL